MPPKRRKAAAAQREIAEDVQQERPTSRQSQDIDMDDRESDSGRHNPTPSRSDTSPTPDFQTPREQSRSATPIAGDGTYENESRAASEQTAPQARTPPPRPTALHYKPSLILHGHKLGVTSCRFSPDGTLIASASADATIKIWDATTGKHLRTLEGHLAGINQLAWSPDGTLIASASDDKTIRLWYAASGRPHGTAFRGHHNYVYSIAFAPKGNMLVSGSYDEAVFIWDVRGARVMKSLPAHSDPVSGVDVVRDGTLIVSCAGDGLIRVWDTHTGQCLRTLVHEDNAPVTSVRFSPNGRHVLAHTLDSCVRMWDYVDGRVCKTYQGHVNQKYSLSGAFGVYGADAHPRTGLVNERRRPADGDAEWAFVVGGSEDGRIVLWDLNGKEVLQELAGHEGAVLCVDTHQSERKIVSCGMDGTVRLWVCDGDGVDVAMAGVDG